MAIATESEAHAEWHRNAGVPMGIPGCPQDACHPEEPDWDELNIGHEDVMADPHDDTWDAPVVEEPPLPLEYPECQVAHDGCTETARWVAQAHTGHSWRVCHGLWIEQRSTFGDPFVTVTYRRLP